jgi:hypothetical protein
MTSLFVAGPLEVGYAVNGHGSKHINREDGREFFEGVEGLAEARGCYVFAIRNRGLRAAYVGKATKGFGQEVFSADKLQKYNEALHAWPHGTPVLLFAVTPPRVRSAALISDVEECMIRCAKREWPELLNKHHTGPDDWDIPGVTTPHPGRRSEGESALASLLGFGD